MKRERNPVKIIQIRIDYERDEDEEFPALLGDMVDMEIAAKGKRLYLQATVKACFEQEMDEAKIVGNIVLHPNTPREGSH